MTRYAERTEVASDRSRAEIERTLQRYGADGFIYGWERDRAMVAFRMKGRRIQFELPLPDKSAKEFWYTPEKKLRRTPEQAQTAWEQAGRQRWRALALYVKATLEAVEAGIVTMEDAFLAWTALPGGASVSVWLQPQIEAAYTTGNMPPLLPAPPEPTP
jgi:hypothetical protein